MMRCLHRCRGTRRRTLVTSETSPELAHRAVKLDRVKRRRWRRTARTIDEPARTGAEGIRLAPIGLALAGALLVGIATATGLVMIALSALGLPRLQPSGTLPLSGLVDVIKLAFAVIAGIGGTVALVVAYRRQRVAEASSQLEHAKEERERVRILNERFSTAG